MQTIYLDISNKGVIPTIYAKQGDVGRKFMVSLSDAGAPYFPPAGSVFSVWYEGKSGEGNYTDIGNSSAFSVNRNSVTVEMIEQMLQVDGRGVLCLILNKANGEQIGCWNIPYCCEIVPGYESEEAKSYFTAFTKAIENLPYPDPSLSVKGKAADAEATGRALEEKAPSGYGLGKTAWRDAVPDDQGGTGFYALSQGAENAPADLCDLIHIGRTEDIATQIAIDHQHGRPDMMIRKKGNGIWGDWRHINLKMLPNTEYLTNEVWYDADSQQYKDVYVKALNFGNLASSGYTSLELGPGLHPISIQGFAYNSQYICDLSSFRNVDEVFYQISNGMIMIHSVTEGASDYKAIVVVKYWNKLGSVIT